ncbi:unnamed protein product, partial [Urochloa humidicola]
LALPQSPLNASTAGHATPPLRPAPELARGVFEEILIRSPAARLLRAVCKPRTLVRWCRLASDRRRRRRQPPVPRAPQRGLRACWDSSAASPAVKSPDWNVSTSEGPRMIASSEAFNRWRWDNKLVLFTCWFVISSKLLERLY